MPDLTQTAVDPVTGRRYADMPQMSESPRSARMGLFADALMAIRGFADKLQIPQWVPLLGGQGVGSLILGKAPEELNEISYGNMPMRINPNAGGTASYMPEFKPGRAEQVADLLSLASVPGGGKTAAAIMSNGLSDMTPGLERAMIAWHGSPHKFDAFDASKIGTGEGAQAYGHGLYLAESPDVAKTYIPKSGAPSWGGKPVVSYNMDGLVQFADGTTGVVSDAQWGAFRKAMENGPRTGQLYKVDIPDETIAKMLDWDKPLSQQPKEIQEVFAKIGIDGGQTGQQAYRAAHEAAIRSGSAKPAAQKEQQMVEQLRRAGIPGIRYLDAGSRNAEGKATSNFVLFPGEEKKAKILTRNGEKVSARP